MRDERLEQVAETVGASNIVYDTIDFHDIAGPRRAARTRARGWATSSSPTSARPTRSSTSCAPTTTPNVIHPEGGVDPLRDIETIETELVFADLEQAERRLERVVRDGARRRARRRRRGGAGCATLIEALQAGPPGADGPGRPRTRPTPLRDLGPLTAKPVLFVANVDEGYDEVPPEIAAHAAAQGAGAVAVSSRIEAELSELDDEDAAAMRADLGVCESGLERVVGGAFALLHLIAFFTAGEDKPAQSWHLRDGLTAWHAAGEIHSDIQKGFVRAEVIGWDALVDAGGYAGARDRGTLRLEGRDYVMRDGDVITVKFTP